MENRSQARAREPNCNSRDLDATRRELEVERKKKCSDKLDKPAWIVSDNCGQDDEMWMKVGVIRT